MDVDSSPVVEEKMMTPVKKKPVPSIVESSITPVKEKKVTGVKELSVMSVMKKGVMSVVKEEVMEIEREKKEEEKMEMKKVETVKEEKVEEKEEKKEIEEERVKHKEEEKEMEEGEKEEGERTEEKEEEEKKEEPSTRLSEEATLARLADLMKAEQARIDRMRDDNHRLRGDVASNRSTPTGTPTGTAEKVLPVRANTQTAAQPVSQTPIHLVSQTPSQPISQTPIPSKSHTPTQPALQTPTQPVSQTLTHLVSQTPMQTTHQTPSQTKPHIPDQTKPHIPDQTVLHTPSQPKLSASHILQVMAETPVKGAADTRSSHEEMLQVKTQELLQRVEDMKKRNEASKRKKEEKSVLTPSRPNLPPSASSWEKLSTAKKVKMEDLTLPVYVKPKENPSERSFISFVSSPMTARLAGKQKRAETGAPASIKSSAKPVSQGLPTVSRNPIASTTSVGPVGPVGPRRVLMTPAQENNQSALPSQVGKEKSAVERVSVKREKAEGVVARSAEKKPELENRVPTVTKLPSNVQSSHSEVKREVIQPVQPALPVQSAQPAQPAQPAQLHHRLNAVEENGKPWYEEPNINRLLYRQHQLVSRFVGQSTGCDE